MAGNGMENDKNLSEMTHFHFRLHFAYGSPILRLWYNQVKSVDLRISSDYVACA